MDIDSKLTDIKGIGPKRAEALGHLGLFSMRDLVYFSPRDYYDLREAVPISDLKHGEYALIRIDELDRIKVAYPSVNGRRTPLVSINVSDGSGRIRLTWFNQPYIRNSIPSSPGGYAYGRVDLTKGRVMVNASFCSEPPGILPVYRLTRGLGQASLRSCVKAALSSFAEEQPETLPESILAEHGLSRLGFAVENIHFPISPEALKLAKRRLSFENTLYFTILLESFRARALHSSGIAFNTGGTMKEFLSLLPFTPTNGQLEIMREIDSDMSAPVPMNRLIQGDVGSGKTALAFYAMFVAAKNGYQSALMAPTGILAEQHYNKLKKLFGDRAVLLTGSLKKAEKTAVLERIKNGGATFIVGTHSLIEGVVGYKDLGLVIADEQHRFGVRQRADLGGKAKSPDVLIMSATPIPRTLSLILYGDLDVSKLTEMPAGRKKVETRFVPSAKRADMYRYIEREILEKHIQAFVVCPLIEDSEDVGTEYSAEAVFAELKKKLGVRIELIHGRMKPDLREEIMRGFRDGETDLIVSTTVIEVGVDVPNACIMVIEAADRFGLAQLHQLRGRVGRSDKESYCFLLSESRAESVADRIKTLVASSNGFEIAEKDLAVRGPGELLGQRQHGSSPLLEAIASGDTATLTEAREAAIKLLSSREPAERDLILDVLKRYAPLLKDVAIN
ncbi:MAG: ATP-dependent DNA helicase RecG [Clostridiales bacterium]|nr:ATP-dependent DNA helicase RecG [Clostridiales bacterium]